jgi:hypothetical protein
MRPRVIQLALVAALLAAAVAYAAERGPFGSGSVDRSQARGQAHSTVKARGHVVGLYPRADRRMRVTVRNRDSRPARLRRFRTRVGNANPVCTDDYLRVRQLKRPQRRIGPRRSILIRVRVRVRPSAPDACQNARWPLQFRSTLRGIR